MDNHMTKDKPKEHVILVEWNGLTKVVSNFKKACAIIGLNYDSNKGKKLPFETKNGTKVSKHEVL